MKLSVITVNLNNKEGLERTIVSVISQTVTNFDFVVIDGGSEDGSAELLQKYKAHFSYTVSEKDSGIYEAMNKGIEAAGGEYLLFLNSGDTLDEPGTLKKVFQHLDEEFDIVYGNIRFNNNGELTEGCMPDVIDIEHLFRDTLWHPVSLIRRDLFERYGMYDTNYRICGDYEFFLRVVSAGIRLKHINQFVSVFELNGLSSVLDNHPLIKEEKERARATYLSPVEMEHFRKLTSGAKRRNFFSRWFR